MKEFSVIFCIAFKENRTYEYRLLSASTLPDLQIIRVPHRRDLAIMFNTMTGLSVAFSTAMFINQKRKLSERISEAQNMDYAALNPK